MLVGLRGQCPRCRSFFVALIREAKVAPPISVFEALNQTRVDEGGSEFIGTIKFQRAYPAPVVCEEPKELIRFQTWFCWPALQGHSPSENAVHRPEHFNTTSR